MEDTQSTSASHMEAGSSSSSGAGHAGAPAPSAHQHASSEQQQQKSTRQFVTPTKRITSQAELQRFMSGSTYRLLQTWLRILNNSVLKKPNSVECQISDATKGALALLEELDKLVDETPPLTGEMRFGNKAFRIYHQKLSQKVVELHKLVVPEGLEGAVVELAAYLLDSFGNPTRLDYGTGHELHFVIWLYCLHALGIFQEADFTAMVTRVFARYLQLVRKIQRTYGLEPAGSRGVWCLDDHQFVPFIWGAAQLVDHPEIGPGAIMNRELVERYADEYLYLGCINHINTVKKGPFFEHSPDLFNASGAASWEKVNKGMILKYNDDVLSKLPILQHMLFGSIFPYA
jgi:serine/threonine-protein phosphatase 2A activator